MYICAILESMTFLRPEILTALFLLAIPLIVHLFEFRIFKPTAFTNLLFLEKLKNEQHRYRRLKKWLILMLRLGYFAGLILAFALPTILSDQRENQDAPVSLIYIDNSFSTNAKNTSGGTLLSAVKEELYQWSKTLDEDQISWFSNDGQYPNQSPKAFQTSILTLTAGPKQLSPQQVVLKAEQIFDRLEAKNRQLIWFTDYHNWAWPEDVSNIEITLRPMGMADRSNICLEEALLDRSNPNSTRINVLVTNTLNKELSSTIRVYLEDNLYAQTGASLRPGQNKIIGFDMGMIDDPKGFVSIEDRSLSYDDTLYFNIPQQPQIKILSIGEASTSVLSPIFEQSDFEFASVTLNKLDYTELKAQNLIILDQLTSFSNPLLAALKQHITHGGGILIIPKITALDATQGLISEFALGRVISANNTAKKIIEINARDPFYSTIFERDVAEFQYPTVGRSFDVQSTATSLMSFDQGGSYLLNKDNIFLFTGPISGPATNFDQSPLSVATMIQIARQTQVFPKPYYATTSQSSTASETSNNAQKSILAGSLVADQVVVLARGNQQLIPRQKESKGQIELDFSGLEFSAGHYVAKLEQNELEWFSFNHPRDESHGTVNPPELDTTRIKTSKDIDQVMHLINQKHQGQQLWFWFVIFALICFLAEMLILKQSS